MHQRRASGLLLLALWLDGCSSARSLPTQPALPAAPAARLAAVRAEEDEIRSLRARFSSVTQLRGAQRSADGVLLVAKPDRFRLRLMLPFGLTVFDYLNVGEQSWMALPLADADQRRQTGEFAPFSRDDLGQAFLRGSFAFPGDCAAAASGPDEVSVDCRAAGELRRTLRIGADGVREETSYADGTPRMRIRYADRREVSGVWLPFQITLEYPRRQQSIAITVQHYDVNPTLSDDLFQPAAESEPQSAAERRPAADR